jgi:hypothetical protein
MAESETGLLSPERIPTRAEMVALHTRMAVSKEALNPETKLEEIKEENLGNLEQTIILAANSSTKERNQYWEERWQEMVSSDSSLASLDERQKIEKQKQVWRNLMVERFKTEKNQPLVAKLKAKKRIGGINFGEEFSEETAVQIYKRYFEGQKQGNQEEVLVVKDGQQEKLAIPSNLNQFIDDVIEAYQENLEAIEQDLEVIVWYAGIFGNKMANKVIFEIIRAKLILADETKKQQLIQQANANDRRNNLTPTEKEFFQWLWEGTKMERKTITTSPPPPTTSPPTSSEPPEPTQKINSEKWVYLRPKPGEPREPPLSNPISTIAKKLVMNHPEILQQNSLPEIEERIKKEVNQNWQDLEDKGIKREEFGQWILGKLTSKHTNFIDYLQRKYNIHIPAYKEGIWIIPLRGELAKMIDPDGAFGFIIPTTSGLFLNLDVIEEKAKSLAYEEGWRIIPQNEFNAFLERVIKEVSPHELVHLFSDLAFWQNNQGVSFTGKIGIKVSKPVDIYDQKENGFWSRGKELNEAITQEIIFRWAKDSNAKIDMPNVYQSEREVLLELVKMVASEKNISEDEAFQYFAKALFTPEDFRRMVEVLDGHEKTKEGKFTKRRPHFTSIIYFLMDWESAEIIKKAQEEEEIDLHYDITLGFIRGSLTNEQKQKIREVLNSTPSYALSPATRKILEEKIS